MLQGFKDFLLRGNIVDLAVAVVIGTAFTALVSTFTGAIIEPIINSFGGTNVDGLSYQLVDGNDATVIDFAAVINAIITFLITAAVVYFIFVVPSKKLMERLAKGEEEEPEGPSEDILLLREIRDALGGRADQRGSTPGVDPTL
ncbi:large conductance mechanosensitive channel protein MscL [Aeromicrobium duanguangcaii]|uniref:Large-conductance mechanosensitive channel n=1 Tax=Aeromicrobium duanguangcaii TaxID=2968086 RepID=A0ABY5KDZ8_9ACTN|nr:large conductance mechanosensitive channel protein MscL [Aeromicrobium duanguangcaii]MCD9155249.1 large conductance mechanosensitive channel protein MscL [Aeromicrobium duanguangcaii]MCL3838600.1 large conductance mechanosensitive channel protein MscL [Aeromicrobium duanguangcaii]UUI68100.1 large conductance mechanosensitive channel protein MscL [Aeromicrobium duanguangcaii]